MSNDFLESLSFVDVVWEHNVKRKLIMWSDFRIPKSFEQFHNLEADYDKACDELKAFDSTPEADLRDTYFLERAFELEELRNNKESAIRVIAHLEEQIERLNSWDSPQVTSKDRAIILSRLESILFSKKFELNEFEAALKNDAMTFEIFLENRRAVLQEKVDEAEKFVNDKKRLLEKPSWRELYDSLLAARG